MDIIRNEHYAYAFDPKACESCGGACCTGASGYIWVRYGEIERIADFLELSVEDFAKIYLRKVGHRYSLTERQIGEDDLDAIDVRKPSHREALLKAVQVLREEGGTAVYFTLEETDDKAAPICAELHRPSESQENLGTDGFADLKE